ncbi:MAG: ATP-binding protein [Actinomycetota bacterium]|nr:ATP-binding protein [Actinomycetota bacterium]
MSRPTDTGSVEVEVDVPVVGGGQAGVGVGFRLSRRTSRCPFLPVDAAPQVGQSWLDRRDSLVLFTHPPGGSARCPGFVRSRDVTASGSGIELAVVAELVRAHGGSLPGMHLTARRRPREAAPTWAGGSS